MSRSPSRSCHNAIFICALTDDFYRLVDHARQVGRLQFHGELASRSGNAQERGKARVHVPITQLAVG